MRQVARTLQTLNNRVFNRITRDALRDAFTRLGLAAGDTVYARASMRRMGYVRGGAQEVIGAILDVIGGRGTLMMAAGPSPDPAAVQGGDLFDVGHTPSGCGLLSEALRNYPGARRSLHPVASVVAAGAGAEELVAWHAEAKSPFGQGTPWARLAAMNPKLLLLGTHLGEILYYVQERSGFPNLYRAKPVEFEVRDEKQRHRRIESQVIWKEVPKVIILPGNRPENRDYLLMQDYALMFPPQREEQAMEIGYLRFNRSRFLGRRERLVARGILKIDRIGLAEAALLDGTRMLDQVGKDLTWDIQRYKEEYDPEQLTLLSLPQF